MRSLILILLISFFSCSDQKKETTSGAPPSKDSTPAAVNNTSSETSANQYATVDVSPMDMTYFPVNYPKIKMAHDTDIPPLARVIYSRPHLQGRNLFQGVLKYGEHWRLGANESTELELYKSSVISDKRIAAGRYVMYCIPQQDKWTIILNSNIDTWGLTQDTTKDVARFDIPVKTNSYRLEYFTMAFEKSEPGADLVMAWDNVEARLPFKF